VVDLNGSGRLVPACTTPVQEGMTVVTNSPKLTAYRRMIVELLLAERNHVCSVCVSNGHCELQSLATQLGISSVRFRYRYPKLPVDLSQERYVIDHNRCILCSRCVRRVRGARLRRARAAESACRRVRPARWRRKGER
jgi:bidirectional [NiFe] hydrogenase diaphorase subunit